MEKKDQRIGHTVHMQPFKFQHRQVLSSMQKRNDELRPHSYTRKKNKQFKREKLLDYIQNTQHKKH